MAMKGRSTCRLMQREGAVGESVREAAGEGRPRAAGPNGVSPAVFRVKEQAVLAAEGRPKRANMGGTAEHGSVP